MSFRKSTVFSLMGLCALCVLCGEIISCLIKLRANLPTTKRTKFIKNAQRVENGMKPTRKADYLKAIDAMNLFMRQAIYLFFMPGIRQ